MRQRWQIAELVEDGAAASVGVDISGNFLETPPPGLELIRGDLSELDSVPELAGRTSDLINVFSAAGLWIETAIEPQLSQDARRRYPHKQAWMNKYLGILIFKLRPHPGP